MVIEAVFPDLQNQQDPNVVLLQTIKDNFGARDQGSRFPQKYLTSKEHKFHVGGANDWFVESAETPYIVVWPVTDQVGRLGIGSARRYHHSKHQLWCWARNPEERWQMVLEIQRILQKYATSPQPGILRFDYYNEQFWQEQVPGPGGATPGTQGMGTLYRVRIDVTAIYIA